MSVEEYWDFVNLTENHDRHFELIRGEVFEMSRPSRIHGMVMNFIAVQLTLWLMKGNSGSIATGDSGVVLDRDPATVVGPDVAYFTDADNIDEAPKKWTEVPPVLAVEILSPSERPKQVATKIEEYLQAGVKLVWYVDPESRTVTIHRPNSEPLTLGAQDELSGGEELPGFSCQVADLFKMPTL